MRLQLTFRAGLLAARVCLVVRSIQAETAHPTDTGQAVETIRVIELCLTGDFKMRAQEGCRMTCRACQKKKPTGEGWLLFAAQVGQT